MTKRDDHTQEGREAAGEPGSSPADDRRHLFVLSLTALGVVFGDIGTSPLYALRECFYGDHAVAPTPANVLGVLSLLLWSLVLVISVKYVAFIMRADNRGEGGILALMALLRPADLANAGSRRVVVLLGIFGASLLYGDGMITPAISVLSAVEGLQIATPLFTPYVVPITVAILVGLFVVQRFGTTRVGIVFGPIMLVWFAFLALVGAWHIADQPAVLEAVLPWHGVRFLAHNRLHGFLVLGAVFLVVTGGEALYADMGHFGKRPIQLVWFVAVLPALVLNYFGQGALVMANPAAAHNPFFLLVPAWALYPAVLLATCATIIASQAIISGCFSLTRQAIQLGYSPRLRIDHTSSEEIGQIYLPPVNWALMFATIGLVLAFETSAGLAAAYGVAVTTTMMITTVLFYILSRKLWHWSRWRAMALAALFLSLDVSFLGANIVKIPHGGWVPLAIAAGTVCLMMTWKRGREILGERMQAVGLPVEAFMADPNVANTHRVRGTAVFMTGRPDGVPPALLHNLKHNKVLHERVVLLTVLTETIPHVAKNDRLTVQSLGQGFYRMIARYGFMEDPNIPALLQLAQSKGLEFRMMETTFFLSRETLIASSRPGMAIWREKLFAIMSRNAQSATTFFHLPTNRVVEIGMQVEL